MSGGVVPALRTSAPAKVNLGLSITARRPDGYHELRSVFLRLDLADEVTLRAVAGPADSLVVEGDPDCPIEGNLALAAVAACRERMEGIGPVSIHLRKRIPMEAGLAGGSSDAAAVLRLLARRSPAAFADMPPRSLVASIGSDVAFFVEAVGAAVVSGVGDTLEPLPPPIEPLGVLLVRPAIGLATGRVFGAWDRIHPRGPGSPVDSAIDDLAAELRAGASPGTVVGLAARLRDANDLWTAAVAVEPRMDACRGLLEASLARPVLMSGSGSTLFAMYRDPAEACQAARALREDLPDGLSGAWIEASASGTPYPPDVVSVEEGT
ncbi:MAG: 4-(cytidine 5'-diphospho)-2-C-methyl-D-erythritol kinase [Candidatus Limnocylindrales bacterium]